MSSYHAVLLLSFIVRSSICSAHTKRIQSLHCHYVPPRVMRVVTCRILFLPHCLNSVVTFQVSTFSWDVYVLFVTHSLTLWCLSVCYRGEENSAERSEKTLGPFGSSRSEWVLGVKPLAPCLQAAPAGGWGWWGDSEKGCAHAALGYTGESDHKGAAFCIHRKRTSVVDHV